MGGLANSQLLACAREEFEEDVTEGLMAKMTLREFKERYGANRAVASLAVIVEDELNFKRQETHHPRRYPRGAGEPPHQVRGEHGWFCRARISAFILSLGRLPRGGWALGHDDGTTW